MATMAAKKKKKKKTKKDAYKKIFVLFSRVIKKLSPLQEQSVLFASDMREGMSGNMQFVHDNLPEGFKSYSYFTRTKWKPGNLLSFLRLTYLMTVCKYIILEDFFTPTEFMKVRKGQQICQLWHGGGFKRFAYGRKKKGEKLKLHSGYKKYAKVIVSSNALRPVYAESFGVPLENVEATGIPKTDLFFDDEWISSAKEKFYDAYPELKNKRIVLLAPTYRGRTLDVATYDFSRIDFEELKQILGPDYAIITRWHPAVYNSFKAGTAAAPDLTPYDGFAVDIPGSFTVEELMTVSDVLITDYSTVMFDYSLTGKPMIFYAYDLDEYDGARGLYFDYEEYSYGEIITEKDKLPEAIKNAHTDPERLRRFREKFMDACDGHASEKTANYFFRDERPSAADQA